MLRLAVHVRGIVQGVGFRPFVYDAARTRGLSGWVQNRTDGLRLEVQGPEDVVHDFLAALRRDSPPSARIEHIDTSEVALARDDGFSIVASAAGAAVAPTLPADQATCAECLAEVASPRARRHRYPFTNCTRCGPRYTIIEALPYDRARTTMRRFTLCAACAAEYADPADRRFHAQPIACPACGPTLRSLAPSGDELARGDAALAEAAVAVGCGRILAVQGLGGFHLFVDATDPAAVALLRRRKGRAEKPFAVMFPSLEAVRAVCAVSPLAAEVLASPAAPIVLLRRLAPSNPPCPTIADAVAPRNPWLGVLLPYTPLHRLLLDAVGHPLVCTSGNLAEEPMCVDERDARARLGSIADCFLVHDRPIVRPVDDSVVRIGPSGSQLLRRARGFAPLPLTWPVPPPADLGTGAVAPALPAGRSAPGESDARRGRAQRDDRCVLALGAQLKSTVALAHGGQVIVSQHLGDLTSVAGTRLLERTVADLLRFFAARPHVLACDLHPDYGSTRLAERLAMEWELPLERVQHHHAHVAACMAEYGLAGPVLGLAWDGAGLGSDGTLWGGEALAVDGARFTRVATLRRFSLPGGEQAMREPRRAALGVLYEIFGDECVAALGEPFSAAAAGVLVTMLERRVQTSATTSMGRLFDAVAALTGIRCGAGFEGQAAMEVEFAAARAEEDGAYPFPLRPGDPAVADWEPLVRALLDDRAAGVSAERMAARFHNALAALAEAIACRAGLERVILTGGCFQNLHLLSAVHARLVAHAFEVYVPRRYPPNDGGIALGQTLVATLRDEERSDVSRHTW